MCVIYGNKEFTLKLLFYMAVTLSRPFLRLEHNFTDIFQVPGCLSNLCMSTPVPGCLLSPKSLHMFLL